MRLSSSAQHALFRFTAALAISALALAACGGQDAGDTTEAATRPSETRETAPAAAETKAPAPPKTPRAELVARMRSLYEGWAAREAALVKGFGRGFDKALGKLRWYRRLSTKAYEAREYQPIFSRGAQLTEGADALLEALYAVEEHGLSPEPYDLEGLRETLKAFSDKSLAYQQTLPIPAEGKALWDFLTAQRRRLPLDDVALTAAAEEAGYSDADVNRLEEAEGYLDRILSARDALNGALRDVDIALTWRYLRYIYDMRLSRRAHPFFADKTDGAGVERTADEVYAAFEATDFDSLGAALKALEPRIPDYAKTKAGLARYRAFAAAYPEHIELPSAVRRLRRGGKKKDLVARLQQRLAQEEYFDGEVDGVFGEALERAISLYQQTHQIKVSGRVDSITRKSLNTSFADRVAQLELSLRRHRESELHQGEWRFGDRPLRGRVNIPAFEATFFKDGEVARQHKVVVGNNKVEVDFETGKKGRFNQTRMFTAELRTVVLNPTWKVPKRIKEQELDLKLMDEPDFYEKHNYDVKILADGTEQVVQLPGPGNALGLVKFLFPNQFAIYMHDTPKKRLFKRPVRAFSHGCMRTENPLDLARWLLVEQGDWTDERFDRVLASRQEYGVALDEKIPVTIDYNTVGVHSSGRMMFYSDVYRYDRDYNAGKTPYRKDSDHYMTVVIN
ncbi:MAG: hypothetical protein CSA66_02975 [Proteobacteria bacterium]|nr:MAG: hypothetical protein CSA66_02975 [Pseudomonadota bacterium]